MSKDKKWIFEKFKGDMAIYQICPECNFIHTVGGFDINNDEYEIDNQYKYCPFCGMYLYDNNEELDVIWNERSVMELYE